GGLLSVALSRALQPVGVTHHHVLRSPDFPPALNHCGLIALRAAASAFALHHDQRPFGISPGAIVPIQSQRSSSPLRTRFILRYKHAACPPGSRRNIPPLNSGPRTPKPLAV